MLKFEGVHTEVAEGTPGGSLLRRYWHPLCPSALVRSQAPLTALRILGEDVVIVATGDGYFAVTEHCPHRGVSLRYGYAEDDCVRCAYHGWLFSEDGSCVEQPFEDQLIPVTARTYPIRELCGLLFIFMGTPATQTPLPRWDMMTQPRGKYHVLLQQDLNCNWVQAEENSADVTHTYFLHSKRFAEQGLPDTSGYDLQMTSYGFQPFEWGILKSWKYKNLSGEEDLMGWGSPLVFPNMLHIEREIHWRVPVDDTHTRIIILGYDPEGGDQTEVEIVNVPNIKSADGTYRLDDFFAQDGLAWETQGTIARRDAEHLGRSDTGVLMFRKMLAEQVARVKSGEDPIGIAPEDGSIISTRKWMGGYVPMSAPPDPTIPIRLAHDEVFDERHVEFPLSRSFG